MKARVAASVSIAVVCMAAVGLLVSGRASASQNNLHAVYVAPPQPGAAPFPSCPAIGVIGSRGSGENNPSKKGVWAQGLGPPAQAFAKDLGTRLRGVQFTANAPPGYPAVPDINAVPPFFHKNSYLASVGSGVAQLIEMLKAQETACSDKTRIYLAGYSQGAEVTAVAFRSERRHDPWVGRIVAGVVLFGDPLFNRKDPSADETALQESTLPSLHHNGALTMHAPWHVGSPEKFSTIDTGNVLSYCLAGDYVCQGIGGVTAEILFRHRHSKYAVNPDPEDAARYFATCDAISKAVRAHWNSNTPGTESLIGQVRLAKSNRTYAFALADLWFEQDGTGGPEGDAYLHRVHEHWKLLFGPTDQMYCSDVRKLPRSVRGDFGLTLHGCLPP